MPIDWQRFHAGEDRMPTVVDPRRRLRVFLMAFLTGLLIVAGRAVQLEVTQGAAFRTEAVRPIEKETALPAPRGRILARDGTILACDRTISAVAIHYRWLQKPPDAGWLRAQIRARLAKSDRKNAEKIAAAKAAVLAERSAAADRAAKLCGLSPAQWTAKQQQIQKRVDHISDVVNRHQRSASEEDAADDSWSTRIRRLLLESPPPPHVTVTEELSYHVIAENIPETIVAEIEGRADRYPGVKIIKLSRRTYPGGPLAAHVLGHLGAVEENELHDTADNPTRYTNDDRIGRTGVEQQYENRLRGRHGVAVERRDRSGRLLASFHEQEPVAGNDVRLSLDPILQHTAEELLQSALERKALMAGDTEPAGGAVVAMDVRTGAIRAAASAPAFDPNLFARGDGKEVAALLADKSHPLFNRVCAMALPPGSTFKIITAVALLESATIGPEETFFCRGYLHQPDRQRCEIYIRQNIGHGEIILADALCISCNVFFFHFAGQMGPQPLLDWARRLGFGRPTGVDLPGEAAGTLPSPENIARLEGHAWRTVDTQSLAVGQGSLTATPLQVLCMIAAVANGGRFIQPRIVEWDSGLGTRDSELGARNADRLSPSPKSMAPNSLSISPHTVQIIREGLRRVVADPQGTAHGTAYLDSVAIAGKTGTAETGDDQAGHAWFAGYAPADNPTMAFVVVLEHAGDAASTAGPLAKRLVLRMEQLGML